ncbi:aldehyde dehydrogenase [Sarocladium strictum]
MAFYNIINGERRTGPNVHQCTDPRTEEPLWDAPLASSEDLDEAVAAAKAAQPSWGQTTLAHRQGLLQKLGERLEEHRQELMDCLMRETGKSAIIAGIDVTNAIGQCNYYAKVGLDDELAFEDESLRIISTYQPLGVVAAICPWNFPIILSNIKIVSALVTGNAVILKPSPLAPYAVLKSIELTHDLFPPGILQVLNGGGDLGVSITSHPGIDKVTFTGSTVTGQKVRESCAKNGKRVTLEMSGNDPGIVCDDVDIKKVASLIAAGSLFNGGQMCVCTKRIYVHESIYDEFLKELVNVVEAGFSINKDPTAPTLFGPLSNKMQFEIVTSMLEDCKSKGFNIVSGGQVPNDGGFWIAPTIISRPDEDSVVVQKEQFGPLVPVLSWSDEDDVIARANACDTGLGAAVYSSDIDRAQRLARRLEAGTVWLNMAELPHVGGYFSGQKNSGYGGEMGKQGLLSYCHTQSLQIPK